MEAKEKNPQSRAPRLFTLIVTGAFSALSQPPVQTNPSTSPPLLLFFLSFFLSSVFHVSLSTASPPPQHILTMAADIGQIAQLLDATLDPTEHRKGT